MVSDCFASEGGLDGCVGSRCAQPPGGQLGAEGLNYGGIKLRAGLTTQLGDRLGAVDCPAMGTVARHRLEGIADGENPGPHGDLLAWATVRIAAAVIALVACADETGDGSHRRSGRQDALAHFA